MSEHNEVRLKAQTSELNGTVFLETPIQLGGGTLLTNNDICSEIVPDTPFYNHADKEIHGKTRSWKTKGGIAYHIEPGFEFGGKHRPVIAILDLDKRIFKFFELKSSSPLLT